MTRVTGSQQREKRTTKGERPQSNVKTIAITATAIIMAAAGRDLGIITGTAAAPSFLLEWSGRQVRS